MSSPGLQLAPNARDDLCGDVAEGAGVSTADEVTRHLDAASDFAVCFDDDLHRCVHSLIRAIDVLASHGRPSPLPAGEGGTDCLGPADHPEPASAVDSDEGRLCDKQDGASRNFLIAEDNAGPSDRGGGAANVSEGVTGGLRPALVQIAEACHRAKWRFQHEPDVFATLHNIGDYALAESRKNKSADHPIPQPSSRETPSLQAADGQAGAAAGERGAPAEIDRALLRKFLEYEAAVDPRTERALHELTAALVETLERGR